jgi:hypothetical protein
MTGGTPLSGQCGTTAAAMRSVFGVRRIKKHLDEQKRYPFLVDVPATNAHESEHLAVMRSRAQQLSCGQYAATRRVVRMWSERSGLEFARFHFADETAAEAFAAEFADAGAVYISRK